MSGSASSPQLSSSSTNSSNANCWVEENGTAHENCKLLFYAEGEFLGEAYYDPGNAPELGYRRGGAAYFCSHCGEIWGRVVLVLSSGKIGVFEEVSKVSCSRHSDQWEVPGSLLGGYRNEHYLNYMPPSAVQREFLVHLKDMERET